MVKSKFWNTVILLAFWITLLGGIVNIIGAITSDVTSFSFLIGQIIGSLLIPGLIYTFEIRKK
jgi:hypothetical protein